MNKHNKKSSLQNILNNTISLEEFAQDFSPEQKQIAQDEIRYYDMLLSLKKIRQKIGLTQSQLATRASVPRTTISKIESGNYNPTIHTLMRLATAMNKRLEVRFL
jgi:DNA-binding XRE family transcriptional regulator